MTMTNSVVPVETVSIEEQTPKNPDILKLDTLPPVAQLRVATCARVADVLKDREKQAVCDETAREIKNISEDSRRDFLKAVYRSLGTEPQDTVLKQAIEKNTIQIYEVPWENLYAISLDGRNVDFFYERNGKRFFSLYERRMNEVRYALFQENLIWYSLREKLENWKYSLYINDLYIPTFSVDYFQKILITARFILDMKNWWKQWYKNKKEEQQK